MSVLPLGLCSPERENLVSLTHEKKEFPKENLEEAVQQLSLIESEPKTKRQKPEPLPTPFGVLGMDMVVEIGKRIGVNSLGNFLSVAKGMPRDLILKNHDQVIAQILKRHVYSLDRIPKGLLNDLEKQANF